MQETKDVSLFTELTAEESASVNGGHYYGCHRRYRPTRYYGCYRPRRVYRQRCGDYYRSVSYYNYDY
jgi:hypothetical protein